MSTAQNFIEKLRSDYPEFLFDYGRKFAFRPPRTIVLGPPEPFWGLLTLHEVSHAILGHRTFEMDVERLRMEAAAWEKARELADLYEVEVDEEVIQRELDTYRDWLHQKSRCPECGLTRFQTPDGQYHCPRCENF
ncbi:TFIIB-type zinc finger domain-containing protein [Candidatus Saccharibacteria bacterium]|nr:TFIIB-type zinc finger domain-containing protein [Candidatus Saccharibacteria bacterium]